MTRTAWLALAALPLMAQPALADGHRGGTMRLLANASAGTLDPQINYTTQFWQIEQATYDGLLAFKKVDGAAGNTIVPDLAEAVPQPADDGKTYVLKLRPGIKFSNGADVTTDDVVATFRRIFAVSSPTAGTFYNGIVGAEACLKTPAGCALPGVVGDAKAGTVTFHLTDADSEFLDKLAVQHALIVPAGSPQTDAGVTPLPGTGPYMISAYDPKSEMKLVRNPYFKQWSADAQPDGYPDQIVYDFGQSNEAEITAVQNGQADWTFDAPPGDRLGELGQKYGKQVHLSPETTIWYAPMNVNEPPFDKQDVRTAVNDAIDRRALANLFGGAKIATPACQTLPPGIPGYQAYCPFGMNPGTTWSAPDMAKAKALVQQSGTAGQKVTVISEDGAIASSIGTYLVSVLNGLGYQATLHTLSTDIEFTYIQNTKNHMQMSVTLWTQDYPAASDFLNVMYSCASFHPGSDLSVNISGFCDKALDAKMQQAMTLSRTDQAGADKIWAEVDREVTDKSLAAVMFVPKQVSFVSARVGNFLFSPQDNWIIDQAWVQ